MRILLTGASGLIASALAPVLAHDGHEIVRLRRTTNSNEGPFPSWNPNKGSITLSGAGHLDAVIHLAGENIAQRWTPAVKGRIRDSRVGSTKLLSKALASLAQPPEVFISASATGYYGNRGDELVDEQSPSGTDFLADVCRDWEAATLEATAHGIRVVKLRLGIVLTAGGGALKKILPAFRLGLGGKLGGGRQFWSWIAMTDLLAIIRRILAHQALRGPINAVSPCPVTNAEFTRTLGAVLRRPTVFTVPTIGIKLLLGETGETVLLGSCRVRPTVLEQGGFEWQFPTLEAALREELRLKRQ